MTLKEYTRRAILYELYENHGNVTRTAKELGISIRGMRNMIRRYESQGYVFPRKIYKKNLKSFCNHAK